MGELINGRTPEEIKRVLEWAKCACGDIVCEECQYHESVCSRENDERLAPDAFALIQHLESERDAALAKVPRWVGVKERLPEESGKYIVCTRKKAVYCTAFRFFHGKGYFATDSNTHITHWMLLPQPPEEED